MAPMSKEFQKFSASSSDSDNKRAEVSGRRSSFTRSAFELSIRSVKFVIDAEMCSSGVEIQKLTVDSLQRIGKPSANEEVVSYEAK